MPHEYEDNEDREPPYNSALATEQGVNGGGGYSVPGVSGDTLRGYKSTAVMLDGHGTAVSVEVGWTHSDDAAGIVMLETKVQASADPSTLFFVNQGDTLDHVTLTGGGNIDYSVVESNQLPLPASSAGATHYDYPTFYELLYPETELQGTVNHEYTTHPIFASATFDNTYFRGVHVDNAGLNSSDGIKIVRLGPFGSYWHFQFVHDTGPDFGKLTVQLGQFTFGEDADPAKFVPLTEPRGALESATSLGPGMSWYTLFTMDCYSVLATKNVGNLGTFGQFRIMGSDYAVVTSSGNDPDDGFVAQKLLSGPGLYYVRFLTNGKNAASTGYKLRFSSILLARESYWGFAAS